jgi:predicted permease
MGSLLQDCRYAVRQFVRSPGFTVSVVLSLALGIGAATAFFSLVRAIVFDPFPYKDADRIVYVQLHGKEPGYGTFRANRGQLEDIRNVASVEDVIFETPPETEVLTSDSSRLIVNAGFCSPNVFRILGVPPILGRVFTAADAPRGSLMPVAVLSYRFWMGHYAGRPEVLGKTVEMNHMPYMVIGVMPPRFTWGGADVYLPGAPSGDPHDYWMVFPKLRVGTSLSVAAAEFQVLVDRYAKEDPDIYPQGSRVRIVSLNEFALGYSGRIIEDLFAAAVVLLIIGCANVSTLLLARGTSRQHEFAVRTSVGAGRGRLIRQLLTESILLSMGGAAVGLAAAYWALRAMPRILPEDLLPSEVAVQLNVPVLIFGAAIAVITGILFGLSPAIALSRPQLASRLQSSNEKLVGGTSARRLHRLPVAGQMALTLLLLAAASGAAKGLLAKVHAIHGFDPDHVLAIHIRQHAHLPETTLQRIQEMETARRDVAQTPGIAGAGFSIVWWPGILAATQPIQIRSNPTLNNLKAVVAPISPQVLSVLRVPLLRGRIFDDAEVQRQVHVAMVNQTFCKRYLGALDPIGQRVRIPSLKNFGWDSSLSGRTPDDWMEVVGVVGDATNDDLDQPQVRPAVFFPYTYFPFASGTLYARASGDPMTTIRSVRSRLRESVDRADTLQGELQSMGWGRERLMTEILGLYSSIALVLAAAGLYGVVSFAVAQRFQELGIRMALGATPGAVVRLVLASTAAMLALGLAGGAIVSTILAPLVSDWGGSNLLGPSNLLVASLILGIVAAIACVFPAWRAATIDPMKALRVQ